MLLFFISIALGLYAAMVESTRVNATKFVLTVRHSIDFLSYITDQTSNFEFKRISTRCSLSLWGLGILVLSGIYSGCLVSSLINGIAKLPFHDFATLVECVESQDCVLFSHKEAISSFEHREILSKNDSFHQRLQKFINVDNFFKYADNEILDKISKEKEKFVIALMSIYNYLKSTDSNKDCLYATVSYLRAANGFPIAKNLSKKYKYELNKFASQVVGTNLIIRITSNYVRPEQICDSDVIHRDLEPVNICGFLGFLFIVAIGYLFGCVVFFIEKMIHAKKCEQRYSFIV